MTLLARRPMLRWLVPVVVALVLAVAGSVVGVISATARNGLPHRTAAQLLVDVQKARARGLSGTIVQNADLGLPSLPGAGGSGSSDLTSLVSGSHTLRLWYAGPDRVRLSLLGSLGESDVVRQGKDLWIWSSHDRTAVHRTVPASSKGSMSLSEMSSVTPQQAADAALKAITPSTRVSTDGTAVVAGRSAYELVLRPRDSAALVSSVRIAVDAATHIPTRVQVFGSNTGKPALQVGFTSFDPTRPEASVFRFDPPPGTKVTQASGALGAGHSPSRHAGIAPRGRTGDEPRLVGSGWTSVVVATVPTASDKSSGSLKTVLHALPTVRGTWGSGHLLQGTLFSALLTDKGQLVVGSVAPDRLYAALTHR